MAREETERVYDLRDLGNEKQLPNVGLGFSGFYRDYMGVISGLYRDSIGGWLRPSYALNSL